MLKTSMQPKKLGMEEDLPTGNAHFTLEMPIFLLHLFFESQNHTKPAPCTANDWDLGAPISLLATCRTMQKHPPSGATLPSEHPLGYHQACKGWKPLLQMKNEAVKFQAFREPFFYPFKRR